MGDQRLEWKIQEEDEFSKSEESKMSMILNKGWRLGKKIVITGMAISSAPIVLPPLVIFSSIGFAVAVPFGFVFVSYACTEKLMSKLLSRPLNSPSMWGYKLYDDDNDYVEEEDVQEDGCRGEFMDDDHEEEEEDEEEEKFREDTKETLEMRIELIGDEKEDEEKPVEDMNEVMEEESRESLYFDNYVEEEEKLREDMNGVMEEERVDGTYFDNDVDVEAEEKPVEVMNGVMEEERADGTYFDNNVEAEEKPLEEYVGDTEEENLRRRIGVMEEYREDVKEFDETFKKEEKAVEVISGEIEEEELLMRERDEENADNGIGFEEGGVEENVGNIEQEEVRPVRETEGVVEESRDEENVGMPVVEEEKPVLGMEGEKGGESKETVMPTFSSSLPQRKGRRKKGKKHVKKTTENMEEEERLVREAKGGLEDSRDEEPLDKLIATGNAEEQNAEEIGGEQNVSGMAQAKYIVGKELPSPQVEIIGEIEDENVSVVTQKDDNVEEAVPVVEEVVPVVDVMREDNMEEAPVVDATQVGYIEEAVPVAEINGLVEEENVNDVAEEDYIVQQVVPVVEINGVTPVAEMNGVTKEENRDDESVGKFANDTEKVRPIKGTKEVMEESKGGVDLKKNIEKEEVPVKEMHGIVKGHEEGVNNILQGDKPIEEPVEEMAMVEETRDEEKADKIGLTDTNAVVAERRDHEIADADQSYSYGSVKSLDHEVDSEPRYVSLEQVSAVKEPTAENLPKEMADSAEHPLSAEIAESKFNKEAHEQEGIIPSKEVLYSEEKIWEQIDAMRKIVGYKAALQATCIEELKALYVFIGVEPPVAFKVPSDLAEINDKLRLLMSIIGVK